MHLTLAALALIVGVAVLVLFGPALIAAVPARLVPWQPPPSRGYPTLPRRAQVLVPSLLVGFCFTTALGSLAGHFLLGVLPWAGPLLLSSLHGDMPSTAVALHAGLVLLAIAAHPLRPNALTGSIPVAGCGWWVSSAWRVPTLACDRRRPCYMPRRPLAGLLGSGEPRAGAPR